MNKLSRFIVVPACCMTIGTSGCQITQEHSIPDYFSNEKKEEIQQSRQRHAIRLKREARYIILCKDGLRNTQPILVRTFDKEGLLVQENLFAAMGKLKQRQEYIYDSTDNKVKVKYYNRHNELSEVEQFNEQGHQTLYMKLLRRNKTRKRHIEVNYDTDNYIQHAKTYDQNERLVSEKKYSYHPNHVLKRDLQIYYNTRSRRLREKRRVRKEYSAKGMLIREYLATAKDTLIRKHIHQYNDEGLLEVSSFFIPANKLVGRKQYNYIPNTKQLSETKLVWLDSLGIEKEHHIKKCNPHGQINSTVYYNNITQEMVKKKYQYTKRTLLVRTEEYMYKNNTEYRSSCFVYEYDFYRTLTR